MDGDVCRPKCQKMSHREEPGSVLPKVQYRYTGNSGHAVDTVVYSLEGMTRHLETRADCGYMINVGSVVSVTYYEAKSRKQKRIRAEKAKMIFKSVCGRRAAQLDNKFLENVDRPR